MPFDVAATKTMAANMVMSSSLTTKLPLLTKLPTFSVSKVQCFPTTSMSRFRINAKLGGSEEEEKKDGKRKFITKEEEPQQYWQTAGEREGENPMATPLPYFFIFGMSTPFIILAIAFANGWIKAPIR